jgi:hypothetical protein
MQRVRRPPALTALPGPQAYKQFRANDEELRALLEAASPRRSGRSARSGTCE